MSLTNFAETESLTDADIDVVEKYLDKVWAGARSKTIVDTFDKFRHECYLNGKTLNEFPPISTAIRGHIQLCFCFYKIRNTITLIEPQQQDLNPQDFGWTKENGVLIPTWLLIPFLMNFVWPVIVSVNVTGGVGQMISIAFCFDTKEMTYM